MKRHMIYGLSAICLILTACGGKGQSSLPAMPVNTAALTTAAGETTAVQPTSVPALTTLSSATTRRTDAGSTLRSSQQTTTFSTVLTQKTFTTMTTTTRYVPPAKVTASHTVTVPSGTTVTTADAQQQQLLEAEQIARQIQEEVMLAEAALQSAKASLADAYTAHHAAQDAAALFETEHAEKLRQYAQGAQGFFMFAGAEDALQVLEHAEYASSTEIGAEGDATSLENMAASIAYIRKCNALRESEGLEPLMVTDRMMAIAQSNLNWSDGNVQHSGQFNVGENLAWGFADDDPFNGWYYAEKEIHGKHYQNIVNPEYAVTGFAVCSANRSGRYSESHGQVFDSASEGENKYTADEYEQRFNNYYNTVQQIRTEYTALQKAVTDTQAAASVQMLAVSQAEQTLHETEEAYKKAEERLAELRNE